MIDIVQRRISDEWENAQPLFDAHWEETERWWQGTDHDIPKEKYDALEEAGRVVYLQLVHDDTLIGHVGAIISESWHTQEMFAEEDIFFVLEEWRGKGLGSLLLQRLEEVLSGNGVSQLRYTTKEANAVGEKVALSRGYDLQGKLWTKRI